MPVVSADLLGTAILVGVYSLVALSIGWYFLQTILRTSWQKALKVSFLLQSVAAVAVCVFGRLAMTLHPGGTLSLCAIFLLPSACDLLLLNRIFHVKISERQVGIAIAWRIASIILSMPFYFLLFRAAFDD